MNIFHLYITVLGTNEKLHSQLNKFVPPGTRLTNDRNRVQSDGVLKQQFPELPKEGIKPNEQDLTEDEIQELINAAKATIGIGAQPSTPDQGAESTDTGTTDY